MNKIAKQRFDYVDIAKGLGMLMVVWGHIMLAGFSFYLVYAVDIPLFFFLAGMMFKNGKYATLTQLVKSRAKSLLLPYVVFSFLTWLVWVAYNYVFGAEVDSYFAPLLQTFIAQGSGGYLVHNVPLWFVTCLFVIEVAYYFVGKLKPVLNILVSLLCAVIGYFMLNNNLSFDFTKLPWNIEAAMSALLFYSAGNLFAGRFGLNYVPDFCKTKKAVAWLGVVIITAVVVIAAPMNGRVSIGSNHLGDNVFLFYVIGFLGVASTVLFATLISETKCHVGQKISAYLRWIGRNSFYFMVTHVPIKGIVIVVLSKLLRVTTVQVSETMAYSGIAFVISMVATSVAVVVINQIMTLLNGKSKAKKQSETPA